MTEEQIFNTLKEINQSIPKYLKDSVVIKKPRTPVMNMLVMKALEDENFPEEKKTQLRQLQENGYFDKEEFSEDPKIAKKINEYTNRKIKEAIKDGRLPSKKQLIKLQSLWKEQKQTS